MSHFEIPKWYVDEEDIWPLSLSECVRFIGVPVQCPSCYTLTVIPKYAPSCTCTGCKDRVYPLFRIKAVGPLDPDFALEECLKAYRNAIAS